MSYLRNIYDMAIFIYVKNVSILFTFRKLTNYKIKPFIKNQMQFFFSNFYNFIFMPNYSFFN